MNRGTEFRAFKLHTSGLPNPSSSLVLGTLSINEILDWRSSQGSELRSLDSRTAAAKCLRRGHCNPVVRRAGREMMISGFGSHLRRS